MDQLPESAWEALFSITMQSIDSQLSSLLKHRPITHDPIRAHVYMKLGDLYKEFQRLHAAIPD